MKKSKLIVKKLAVLLCLACIFMLASGFTYEPSLAIEEAEINFETGKEMNLSQSRPTYQFYTKKTIDGKTGNTSVASWDRGLYLIANPEKYADVHDVKVIVEWYDAVHGQNASGKFFRMQYMDVNGSMITGGYNKGKQSGEWVTTEITINDIDFTKTGVNKSHTSSNIGVYFDNLPVTLGTDDTSDDYYGMLIRSVKIVPLTGTYKLSSLDPAPSASFKVGESNDEFSNMTTISQRPPQTTITLTDKNGVTKTGHSYGNSWQKDVLFKVDPVLFANVKKVNVEVTYYDGMSSTAVKVVVPASAETNVEGGQIYTKNSGLWKTQVFTLTGCDFSQTPYAYATNLDVYTGNNSSDNGTADDTSDDHLGTIISEVKVTAIPDYTFSTLKFTDAQGNKLSSLNKNSEFYTELDVTKNNGETSDITLIVALMSKDGKLEKLSYHPIANVAAGETKHFKTCFVTPDDDATERYLKIMVWDSMTTLKPLSNTLICK